MEISGLLQQFTIIHKEFIFFFHTSVYISLIPNYMRPESIKQRSNLCRIVHVDTHLAAYGEFPAF